MNRSVVQHMRCPDTLSPLDLQTSTAEGDDILAGMLSPRADASSREQQYPVVEGIPSFVDESFLAEQTVHSFDQKWSKHDYYRQHTASFYTQWYLDRYGFGSRAGLKQFLRDASFVLDAGTGMGRDAELFAGLSSATVFAVDASRHALEAARGSVTTGPIIFVQADLNRLPFPDGFFDFISCDQVIHHTADPRAAFEKLGRKLKPGGQICVYVYKKKAVVREFTDDYVRERINQLPIDEALQVCKGITELGRVLSNLHATIELEEDIPVLGIRKGRYDLQRFIHWNVMKCFWNDEFDFFTNNIVNFDWYHPQHCFRFEPEEFSKWFDRGWEIQAWDVQEAGISCRARKLG